MNRYVLFTTTRCRYFDAVNDRAARGEARRILGRVGATYQLGDEYTETSEGRGLRPVVGYCLGESLAAGHAALYAVTAR